MPTERRDTASAADGEAGFVAFVYENDYRKIQELVHQYPNIETGGDLFGLWKNDRTVVIQLFIGPGKKSVRTTTSFHQDVEYLHRVGSLITTEEGLCNVGEWHSHHQIGMPEPSAADRRTVFNNMPHLGLERFVLFIATIETGKRSQGKAKKRSHDVKPEQVVLRSFLFLGPTHDVLRGEIKIMKGKNPHQIRNRAIREIEAGAELPPSEESQETSSRTKSKSSDEKSVASSARAQQTKQSSDTKELLKTAQEKPSGRPDQESLRPGRKPQDDQQYGRQVDHHSTSKSPGKSNPNQAQATGGFNNENMSPNFGLAPQTNRGTQRNASFPGLFPANQGSQFSNPSQQTHMTRGRGREPSTSPSVSPLYYHSAVTRRYAQYQTRNDNQREMQEMLPYSTSSSSKREGFPVRNDPEPTSRTTAAGPVDTTSYFKQQGVNVGIICGKGHF